MKLTDVQSVPDDIASEIMPNVVEGTKRLGFDWNSIDVPGCMRAINDELIAIQTGKTKPWLDIDMCLGALWGQLLTHQLNWRWQTLGFDDGTHDIGVISPLESMFIRPFYFVSGCLQGIDEVTIMLVYNTIEASANRELGKPGQRLDIMEMIHHKI